MSKKILITIVSIIVIVVGILTWYFFFRTNTVQTPTTNPVTGLPFGEGGGNVVPNEQNSNINGVVSDSGNKAANKLFQISDAPVAGFVAFSPKKDAPTIIRYVDRATGHIYDVNPFTLEKTKITNNTIPKIIEAYFKNDGSAVLLRSLTSSSIVQNISLSLIAPKASSTDSLYTIITTELRGNMGDVWVGPNNLLAYSLVDDNSISTSNFDGTKATRLFSSAFTDWRVQFDNPANIVLVTKTSANVSGFAYNLSTKTGALSKLVGPLNALTLTESPDNKRFAYSYNSNGQTIFALQTVDTGEITKILPATFADKCVWSKKNTGILYCGTPNSIGAFEPDNWYRGTSHFSDQIWKFNMITATSEILAEPKKNSGIDIDTENVFLSPNEDYLIFMNKNDLTLWALKLQ